MDNVLKLKARWDKISGAPKWKYIMFNVVLLRFVLLMAVIIMVTEVIIFQDSLKDLGRWISTLILRLVFAGLIGVYVGFLEWDFIKKLACKEFENIKSIKQKYILIYGFLSFGLVVAVALLKLPFEFPLSVVIFMIYALTGLLFGFFMYLINHNGYSQYLKNQSN